MTTLRINYSAGGRLETDKGIYHLESRYYEDDTAINDETGEAFEVMGSTTDEDGQMETLDIE